MVFSGRTPQVPRGDAMSTTVRPSAATEVEHWLERFDSALRAGDPTGAAELFATESYWRDLVAFTWNIRTVEGREGVADMLRAAWSMRSRVAGARPRSRRPPRASPTRGSIRDRGRAGQRPSSAVAGRAWTLLTALEELKGHEERLGFRRPKGVEHGATPSATPGWRTAGARPRSWGSPPSPTR